MFKKICVTNSKLCEGNFLTRIEQICEDGIDRIILREKHLSECDYIKLYKSVNIICKNYNVPLFAHGNINTVIKLNAQSVHLPFSEYKSHSDVIKNFGFEIIGTSVHSVNDAKFAEEYGADYVIAGHIFETACKSGVKPRGLEFLSDVCKSVNIPVFAIGGITPNHFDLVKSYGADGACMMSGMMTTPSAKEKGYSHYL